MATLYIVATPIGNLEDFSPRAQRILQSAGLIACEDTRTSKPLLQHFGISTPTVSYHQHSGAQSIARIVKALTTGTDVAVITDAGTPGISDPGNLLVQLVAREVPDVVICPIPGPSALIAALSISGLPTDRFSFFGFLPHKKGRQTMLADMLDSKVTSVCYESTHRITKLLEAIVASDPERQLVVCRELTKKFETMYRGNATAILEQLTSSSSRGEFVVVVSPDSKR